MEEFKRELKSTVVKIENQLKTKVDSTNFESYGKQMDNKISSEFSKKIEKNDLRKNNIFITKKVKKYYIDNLLKIR